jgi:hypothetical protein
MIEDSRGLAMTTATPAAVAAFDRTVLAFAAHSAETPRALGDALALDPGLVLARCAKGFFLLLLCRSELTPEATEQHRMAAEALHQRGGTARETAYVAALGRLVSGDMVGAIGHLDGIVAEDPHDLLAFKLAHALRFILGDARGMRASSQAALDRWAADLPGFGYVLGCHAFGLEETGEYRAAERIGREAVVHAPDDAWGLHAVAHVHEMTGAAVEGLNWLEGRRQSWSHCNNFGFHVFWHKCLFHLDLGHDDRVVELYDSVVRPIATDDFRDIANAASLLWRLERDGIPVGRRWDELAAIAERRIEDMSLVFASLHYLLCLLGARRFDAAEELVAALGRRGKACDAQSEVARTVGEPLGRTLLFFALGQHAEAMETMSGLIGEMGRLGGSHAQRDVFVRTLVDAARLAAQYPAMVQIISRRSRLKTTDSFVHDRLRRARLSPDMADAASGKGDLVPFAVGVRA